MSDSDEKTRTLACALLWESLRKKARLSHRLIRAIFDRQPDWLALFEMSAHELQHKLSEIPELVGEPDPVQQSFFQAGDSRVEGLVRILQDKALRETAAKQAQSVQKHQIWAIHSGDPLYPKRLKAVDSSPAILYGRGDCLPLLLERPFWVTVIGTRQPTPYGERVTRAIVSGLSLHGCVIASGMARGVDTLAHQTALEHQGLTVAVLGCGLDLVYPPENKALMGKICQEGVVLSEHPPGVPPRRQHFPARNRILSALSDVTAVMEASRQSGTLITAGYAADQGRDVFAVPGGIFEPTSDGCHQLIRDGAHLLVSAADILDEFAVSLVQQWVTPTISAASKSNFNALDQKILDALRSQSLSLNQLAQHTAHPVPAVIAAIAILELGGMIELRRGRYALTGRSRSSI
jgi:DNA processing protein